MGLSIRVRDLTRDPNVKGLRVCGFGGWIGYGAGRARSAALLVFAVEGRAAVDSTGIPAYRLQSSSFLGSPYRILSINHKQELLRGLWVDSTGISAHTPNCQTPVSVIALAAAGCHRALYNLPQA